mgnify:CR=1 FL=1
MNGLHTWTIKPILCILDAITFALGENKPTVMRAPNLRALMHDIDGAARRGPKLARSSVHFDNTDRKIPVDSDIVTITREMSEKGENVYYLNKVKVLRGKILDLMNLANAGLNQINNVQQGTVQRISEMNGEEKRQVIEDLVGLSDFDEKKKDAENRSNGKGFDIEPVPGEALDGNRHGIRLIQDIRSMS